MLDRLSIVVDGLFAVCALPRTAYALLSFVIPTQCVDVTVDDSVYRGFKLGFRGSEAVRCYLGIPYAAPPRTPAERWLAPRPPPGGAYSCRFFGPQALQQLSFMSDMFAPPVLLAPFRNLYVWLRHKVLGLDPCWASWKRSATPWNLNVFVPPAGRGCDPRLGVRTPSTKPGNLRPVFVWYHGGAFVFGGSSVFLYANADRIAKLMGVVVVTVNSRLGVFGFAPIEGAPHNRGLLDAVASLKWIQSNIRAFGGDPNRVTLCGESAGAMTIASLLGSPLVAQHTHRLFHSVVLMSGALTPSVVSPTVGSLTAEAFGRFVRAFKQRKQCSSKTAVDTVGGGSALPALQGAATLSDVAHLSDSEVMLLQADFWRSSDRAFVRGESPRLLVLCPVVDSGPGSVFDGQHPLQNIASGERTRSVAASTAVLTGTCDEEYNFFMHRHVKLATLRKRVVLLACEAAFDGLTPGDFDEFLRGVGVDASLYKTYGQRITPDDMREAFLRCSRAATDSKVCEELLQTYKSSDYVARNANNGPGSGALRALFSSVLSDAVFRLPQMRLVEALKDGGATKQARVFVYRIDLQSEMRSAAGLTLGAAHVLELPLLFRLLYGAALGLRGIARSRFDVADAFCSMFASFLHSDGAQLASSWLPAVPAVPPTLKGPADVPVVVFRESSDQRPTGGSKSASSPSVSKGLSKATVVVGPDVESLNAWGHFGYASKQDVK